MTSENADSLKLLGLVAKVTFGVYFEKFEHVPVVLLFVLDVDGWGVLSSR